MSLKEQIRDKSSGLVQRETVRLPECGLEVQVRGLMAGEIRRAGQSKNSDAMQIALSTEDPASGKPVWNANKGEDIAEIEALHLADFATITRTCNRLSGLGKMRAMMEPQTEDATSSSSSPSSSAAPSGS